MKKKVKTITKVSFEVTYNPPIVEKISELMSGCDLGISKIEQLVSEEVSWETDKVVDKEYLKDAIIVIKNCLISLGARPISVRRIKK